MSHKRVSIQIPVPNETIDSSPHSSKSFGFSDSNLSAKESVFSKLFCWSREEPRVTSEYVDKKYDEPFNKVAPELRAIGGLGRIKCVEKHEQQPLINRPTQVQKLCHTKTKLLPNFPLTERLRPAACPKTKKASALDVVVERVKLAENLASSTSSSLSEQKETKELFDHQNPFNLDLNALSNYQKQKYNAEEIERRKNYQIIHRTMETKALKTEGVERIARDERNERFKLPAFFNVNEAKEMNGKSDSSDVSVDVKVGQGGCKVVSTMEKPAVREVLLRHLEHKEEKLRKRLQMETKASEKLAQEAAKLEEEKLENFVFRLADESFPASECDFNERVATKELPPTYKKFDYPVNDSELLQFKRRLHEKSLQVIKSEKELALDQNQANKDDRNIGISCGQKIGNRVLLRGWHDRVCDEPRGESNYHQTNMERVATCLTHKEWLNSMANDPEMLRAPPRGILLSTCKVKRDPNDDAMFLFDDGSKTTKRNFAIESPIRQHIRRVDEQLRVRMIHTNAKKSKSHLSIVDNNANANRYRRMKFMGIPVPQSSHAERKLSRAVLQTIVAKVSETSILSHENSIDKSTSNGKHPNAQASPEEAMLLPKVPEFDYTMEKKRERSRVDKFVPFSKAQPRGTNAKLLRADKSLPWIQDELNATKVKLERDSKDGKSFANEIPGDAEADVKARRKNYENSSAMRKIYKEIIVDKLQGFEALDDATTDGFENSSSDEGNIDDGMQSTVESSSSISSVGTYFTDDSGSYLLEADRKTPKSQMNLQKKFQNRSLVTTRQMPAMELEPYFVPQIGQFHLMKELCKPKDKFHTFRTRSCANIRERIEIESPPFDEELIGNEKFMAKSRMATDVDEFYQTEMYHERSRSNFRFKPISEMIKLREMLRKKMDIYWMKERIVLDEIDALKQEAAVDGIKSQIEHYENFLTDFKQKSYRQTIRTIQEVKNFYHETDCLRKKRIEVGDKVEPLKMNIFFLGNDFVRLSILQKFQYLLKPIEWRLEHDFIHRAPDGKLESFKDSIASRETSNLWDRNNVSVYTIKNFVSEVFMKRKDKPARVFESGHALMAAYKELQSKSYRSLLQFHTFAHILSDVSKEFVTIAEKNDEFISNLNRLIQSLGKKRIFMESRAKIVSQTSKKTISKPLQDSLSAESLRATQGLIDIVFQEVVLGNGDAALTKSYTSAYKFSGVENKALKLLKVLDSFPRDVIIVIEEEIRSERKRKLIQAERAYKIELNVQHRIAQLLRCLTKPPLKTKREGKLAMSVLPKKPSKVQLEKPLLTPIEEEYIRAFTELGSSGEIKFDENAKQMIDRIKNESIPFYLDHLFDTLGIKFTKITEAQTEHILLDEASKLKDKEVLPAIRSRVKRWEYQSKQVKQDNIRRTPYLYK